MQQGRKQSREESEYKTFFIETNISPSVQYSSSADI